MGNKEDIKKTQDKIIKITRITGATLFLIGIAIIAIVSVLKKQNPLPSPKEGTIIEYEAMSDNIGLYAEDDTLLSEQYIILNSMEDYNNFTTSLNTWYQDAIINYTNMVNTSENITEDVKQNWISEYKTKNDERYNKIKKMLSNTTIKEETFKEKSVIVIEDITNNMVLQENELEDICLNNGTLTIHINKEVIGVVGDSTSSMYFVELDKSYVKDNKINIVVSDINNSLPDVAYKPIIYIYPEEEQIVDVKLGYKENLLVSYPVYDEGWNVLAKPDGTLIDNKTNRELYSLYYESQNKIDFKIEEDGFVISKEEIIPFLEEKLEILGLNPREQEEFIIYWLPILQKNNYTYIRFAEQEEINKNMPLQIEPKPQTTIRVLMTFKGLENKINVKEQELTKIERKGYTVVEWGATILE